MGEVTADMSVSVDGFISGPGDLDDGYYRVVQWMGESMAWREQQETVGEDVEKNRDWEILCEIYAHAGAYVMGRRTFDADRGALHRALTCPSACAPFFVVTRHAPEPTVEKDGTVFTFVTDGVVSAVEQARAAAGGKNVAVSGGANVLQQVIRAGLLDELRLHVSPVLLGGGIRLFDNGIPFFGSLASAPVELEKPAIVEGSGVTHLHYQMR